MAGLGDLPDDGKWLDLFGQNDDGQMESAGKLALSIQIIPEPQALARPSGLGRDDPNVNPFLPPPVGRMQLSLNPIDMMRQLMGPELWRKFCCCCCCIVSFVFMGILGSVLGPFITILEAVK